MLLVGVSGSGKSTFARAHFRPTEVLSSDAFRGLVGDDEGDQSATADAFEVLHLVAAKRLSRGRLTVIDATNVQRAPRASLLALAKEHHALAVAVVLDLPKAVCRERNARRPDRAFGPGVLARQTRDLEGSLKGLRREGFHAVYVLGSPEEVEAARVVRRPLWTDRRGETGPFDVIGDPHGCADELEALLERLGYGWEPCEGPLYGRRYRHPAGRKAVFLGDLMDRGPRSLDTVGLVQNMVAAGTALCVPGNHDVKLVRKLRGQKVAVRHGLETTLAELAALEGEARARAEGELVGFLGGLVSHFVLDGGKLVVAHAGLRAELQGRASRAVREFALYGETTGETDAFGLPVRHPWAEAYRGAALVVYGHTPVPEPSWLNGTVNVDTGCVFGGALTALRYPERETVQVKAARVYAEPMRPFLEPEPAPLPGLLLLTDVLGKRTLETRLKPRVPVSEAQAAAALGALGETVDPRWLVYLPPTMAAPETSARPGWLEHPDEAFAFYRREGVDRVVLQEKHMGSRAVAVVCRSAAAAAERFGVEGGRDGVLYTRTGRPFFGPDDPLQAALLSGLREALTASGFWDAVGTDWVVLDAELLPWSAKAGPLLAGQYAPVAAAAALALPRSVAALEGARERGLDVGALLERFQARRAATERYTAAYRRYGWPVEGVDDLKWAPFHLLATEGAVHTDKPHRWHLETLRTHLSGAPGFTETRLLELPLDDPDRVADAVAWWEALTEAGGEGMVVKPEAWVTTTPRGEGQTEPWVVQPGLKVRGRDDLRLIYGPEYTLPEHLERLRGRSVRAKRARALQEFALGVEALERFVRREPLWRVHECVAGILALESEPSDPRL